MDKTRGMRPLEEDVDVPANIDMEESNAEDDEMASVLRRSREEHEYLQMRRGTESSNEAFEKNRPATVSGVGALSIPLIARLSRAPHRISTKSLLRTTNPLSILIVDDLALIRCRYRFPNEVQLRLPFLNRRADTLAIPQLMSNEMRVFLGLIVVVNEAGVELTVNDFLALYYSYSQDWYFFMLVNEKSLGALADVFFPLWGPFRSINETLQNSVVHRATIRQRGFDHRISIEHAGAHGAKKVEAHWTRGNDGMDSWDISVCYRNAIVMSQQSCSSEELT
ncbi:hypothetical protein TIFTF001_032955 [Ficus carica]|uniref:Uncharacterized protein n=1 Tax=Ficus carica TaxID=3494 RepID=A0AA88DXN5_FICCA|nr:hypothetical protein TIFTF001_032955 [Ficus carica]